MQVKRFRSRREGDGPPEPGIVDGRCSPSLSCLPQGLKSEAFFGSDERAGDFLHPLESLQCLWSIQSCHCVGVDVQLDFGFENSPTEELHNLLIATRGRHLTPARGTQ